MMNRLASQALLAATLAACLTGCGDGQTKFGVAPTTGQVLCNGKPVPDVTIYFEPLQVAKEKALVGKQGIGFADEDGNFTISTYNAQDGAVVGKHRVRVGRPLGEGTGPFKCDCVVNEEVNAAEVEVVEGDDNVFTIDLKPLAQATPKEQELSAKTVKEAAEAAAENAENED